MLLCNVRACVALQITQQLAGLVAEVGMREYQHRIETLRTLVSHWQQGHDVAVLHVLAVDDQEDDHAATSNSPNPRTSVSNDNIPPVSVPLLAHHEYDQAEDDQAATNNSPQPSTSSPNDNIPLLSVPVVADHEDYQPEDDQAATTYSPQPSTSSRNANIPPILFQRLLITWMTRHRMTRLKLCLQQFILPDLYAKYTPKRSIHNL